MEIFINNINILFNQGIMADVQVFFRCQSPEREDRVRETNLNGNVTLSPEEYMLNPSIEAIKDKVKEKITDGFSEPEAV